MTGKHIIRRQLLEVDFQGAESRGYALQTEILDLCERTLAPALEKVFERLVPVAEHWRVDRLEVDVGELAHDRIEDSLASAVAEAVERQLGEHANHGRVTKSLGAGNLEARATVRMDATAPTRRGNASVLCEAFVFFLETGLLPWWIDIPAGKSLEEMIRAEWTRDARSDSSPAALVAALQRHSNSPRVRRRLVRQFSADFLMTLLAETSTTAVDMVRSVIATLDLAGITNRSEPEFVFQVLESALSWAFAEESITDNRLLSETLQAMAPLGSPRTDRLLAMLAPEWPTLARPGTESGADERQVAISAKASSTIGRSSSEQTTTTAESVLDEGVFLRCAGIVLVHPFLPRFFEGLGIVQHDKLVKPERAIGLLHFLATGHRAAPEYDLALAKLLCGVRLDTTLPFQIELSAEEEDESDALLRAVIRHWDALGATSVDGLRGSYLVRPGKLQTRGDDLVLLVERRAYDVLLDQLPWGIGLVKLPWMETTLWVEWRM